VSEQQRANRARTGHEQDEQPDVQRAATTGSDEGFDALLDEIDGLLENNAAEYVRSFVQKGGQ